MARRHRSCWIHVSFGVTPVLSLSQNDAIDPEQTLRRCSCCTAQERLLLDGRPPVQAVIGRALFDLSNPYIRVFPDGVASIIAQKVSASTRYQDRAGNSRVSMTHKDRGRSR
jgi:hypothetical protein